MVTKLKKTVYLTLLLTITLQFISCESTNSPAQKVTNYEEAVDYSLQKLHKAIEEIPLGKYPIRTKGLGEWKLTDRSAWTSGFFPGCLWLANKLKPDTTLLKNALLFTQGLEEEKNTTSHHDVGFMILNSYGHAYNQLKDEKYKEVILHTANSLATRFNPNVGCIQSWGGEYQVIMDNMMNLEILFWAAKNGGSSELYDIAVSHADKTIQNHIRPDGGSYHVVHYNPETGDIIKKRTEQGYADESTWARGQAWGIYGFTMMYRETKDDKYLSTAIKLADYFINHLPKDFIPYWDFNLPEDSDRKFRDASAATIALSAFLELRNYVSDSSKYDIVIDGIYNSLLKDYISINTKSSGIINHCAYNANKENPFDSDASTSWGDYYFLEALVRYKNYK